MIITQDELGRLIGETKASLVKNEEPSGSSGMSNECRWWKICKIGWTGRQDCTMNMSVEFLLMRDQLLYGSGFQKRKGGGGFKQRAVPAALKC
jgi:hypothetical protein